MPIIMDEIKMDGRALLGVCVLAERKEEGNLIKSMLAIMIDKSINEFVL